MPAAIAIFCDFGIALMSHSRTGVALIATKTRPATNTPASAAWNESPIDFTTTNAKNAFSPMPGAVATG